MKGCGGTETAKRGIFGTGREGGKGMRLIFVGADHEVTGSCHYMQVGDKHILVDYGMEQGVNVFENASLPVSENQIDYVLLTHAHIDHTGLLPLLYARGFRGQVYATDATADLCSIMHFHYAPGLCPHTGHGGRVEKPEGQEKRVHLHDGAAVYHGGCRGSHQTHSTLPL